MIMVDCEIEDYLSRGWIDIEPYDADRLQPASYDLTLAKTLLLVNATKTTYADLYKPLDYRRICAPYLLPPGGFILGATAEQIYVSDCVVGQVEGKSSVARLGIQIHATAGYIDPGFTGQITLEISNLSSIPFMLRPDMPIGQIVFHHTRVPATRPYGSKELGSHYQNQRGVTPSFSETKSEI